MSKKQPAEGENTDQTTRTVRTGRTPHARVTKAFLLPSLAKQSFADECNINNIMAKFNKTGILEHENKRKPRYGDLIDAVDYHSSLNKTIEAQDAFDNLPSAIRSRFNNEPGEFLEFVDNPENAEELVTLGLAEPLAGASAHAVDAPSGGPDQTAPGAPEAPLDPVEATTAET